MTDWTKDPRYGQPGWTLITDENGSRFVRQQERNRRRKPRPLRFAAVKVGDVLVHRGKVVAERHVQPAEGFEPVNDNRRTEVENYAGFHVVTHRWFDPCKGWDDSVAGEMVATTPINGNGIVGGRPTPTTIRGLACGGFHYADPDQAERVNAFIYERRVLIGQVHAGELTREEAALRATPYRELVRGLA